MPLKHKMINHSPVIDLTSLCFFVCFLSQSISELQNEIRTLAVARERLYKAVTSIMELEEAHQQLASRVDKNQSEPNEQLSEAVEHTHNLAEACRTSLQSFKASAPWIRWKHGAGGGSSGSHGNGQGVGNRDAPKMSFIFRGQDYDVKVLHFFCLPSELPPKVLTVHVPHMTRNTKTSASAHFHSCWSR